MEDTNRNEFEFDDEFWAEMDRRKEELERHPERALTHEEVMASVEEVIRRRGHPY